MPFVFFQTFGCQMNVADSDEFRQKLSGYGFIDTDCVEDADLIIVNTCSVRENAEKRAIARITEFAKLKKKRSKLWVIGCMAQRLGDKLKEMVSGVSLVIGAKAIGDIDSIIDAQFNSTENYELNLQNSRSEISEYISIMRGCNNYCAYCIVPYVRGPEASISVADIENTIKRKVSDGLKEVTLLGQNVNSYNDNGVDFPELLMRVASIEGLKRIRFTTSHPKDCNEKLIQTIAQIPSICHHIHLPVQAGADRILSMMNRKYTNAGYRSKIEMIRKYLPDADITTDIIVGFPTESDSEFDETLRLVQDVKFTTAFMFAYSVREGTAAAKIEETIPREKKIERLNTLIAIQTEITRGIYDSMIGKNIRVMVSGRQEKKDRLWMGQDIGCKRVLVTCGDLHSGMILNAKVIKSSGMTLIAESLTE